MQVITMARGQARTQDFQREGPGSRPKNSAPLCFGRAFIVLITVFDNCFSVRCGDENIETIFWCKMKNKVKIMNSSLLQILVSIHQVIFYHLNKKGVSKAALTTRHYSLTAISILHKDDKIACVVFLRMKIKIVLSGVIHLGSPKIYHWLIIYVYCSPPLTFFTAPLCPTRKTRKYSGNATT